jgi:uncharacterized protein (DUF433 family)
MVLASGQSGHILRTERGLTIAGSRISLYEVIDLLKAQYPPKLIRDMFNLTDEQINAALLYINDNKTEIEAEYQEVLLTREEIWQYWGEYNRERFAQIATAPRKPEHKAIWAKLDAQRARRQAAQN